MERWKDIPGYEGFYQASNMGNVRRDGKLLKPFISPKGYCLVCLCKNNIKKTKRKNRLVAIPFLPNPDPALYDQINHINGIKTDDRLVNLEWSNNSLNQLHAIRIGLRKTIGNRHLSQTRKAS